LPKTAITSALVLIFLNTSIIFQIKADSSDFATRAVLSQKFKTDSKWHLVAFFNNSLSLIEYNYKIHNKKMLAIIQAFKE